MWDGLEQTWLAENIGRPARKIQTSFCCLQPKQTTTIVTMLKLYDVHEVPEYLREPFITGGYRAHLTFREALMSILEIHNETAQIWTHLLPALWFWSLSFKYLKNSRLQMIVGELHTAWTRIGSKIDRILWTSFNKTQSGRLLSKSWPYTMNAA